MWLIETGRPTLTTGGAIPWAEVLDRGKRRKQAERITSHGHSLLPADASWPASSTSCASWPHSFPTVTRCIPWTVSQTKHFFLNLLPIRYFVAGYKKEFIYPVRTNLSPNVYSKQMSNVTVIQQGRQYESTHQKNWEGLRGQNTLEVWPGAQTWPAKIGLWKQNIAW